MKSELSPYKKHVAKWSDCTGCDLCKVRKHVVISRGSIPCEVLFVGEAPGPSEDVTGLPFAPKAPAGDLLECMIRDAGFDACDHDMLPIRRAFTNLVCCIPKEKPGKGKFLEPPESSIKACSERLVEFVKLCNPKVIICVGELSKKHLPQILKNAKLRPEYNFFMESIMHPAGILRDTPRKPLLIRQTIVTLNDIITSPAFMKETSHATIRRTRRG